MGRSTAPSSIGILLVHVSQFILDVVWQKKTWLEQPQATQRDLSEYRANFMEHYTLSHLPEWILAFHLKPAPSRYRSIWKKTSLEQQQATQRDLSEYRANFMEHYTLSTSPWVGPGHLPDSDIDQQASHKTLINRLRASFHQSIFLTDLDQQASRKTFVSSPCWFSGARRLHKSCVGPGLPPQTPGWSPCR